MPINNELTLNTWRRYSNGGRGWHDFGLVGGF